MRKYYIRPRKNATIDVIEGIPPSGRNLHRNIPHMFITNYYKTQYKLNEGDKFLVHQEEILFNQKNIIPTPYPFLNVELKSVFYRTFGNEPNDDMLWTCGNTIIRNNINGIHVFLLENLKNQNNYFFVSKDVFDRFFITERQHKIKQRKYKIRNLKNNE